MLFFLAIPLLILATLGFRHWSKKKTRASLLVTPLSEHARSVIKGQVPLFTRLPADLLSRLEGKVNLFLDQVDFIGCEGLEVSEEMRLSISAQACLLVANSDIWFENLTTVLIYPNAFKSRQSRQTGFVVTEKEVVRTGESWTRGPVILSWAHSKKGAMNDRDGQNVVFHEFAHQLDDLSGRTNGVPILSEGQKFSEWEQTFLTAFDAHVRAVDRGEKTVIDAYGAEGHEEFFAVSVEVFFERPRALKNEVPAVYEQLAKLFKLEPIAWEPSNQTSFL